MTNFAEFADYTITNNPPMLGKMIFKMKMSIVGQTVVISVISTLTVARRRMLAGKIKGLNTFIQSSVVD